MKTKLTMMLIICLGQSICMAQIAEQEKPQQQPQSAIKKHYLTKTTWGQGGIYTRYVPGKNVLGCWSTAMAQILFYHHLKPHGIVNYTCTQGYQVSDTLDNQPIKWEDMTLRIHQNTGQKNADAVAYYGFLTAEAIRKDFGTSKYLEMVNPALQIKQHFNCIATFYMCITGNSPFSKAQMEAIAKKEHIQHVIGNDSVRVIVKREIGAKRPLYFHMSNFTTYGHSTVIDAFEERDGVFYVHLNYGSGGFRTGWYDLFKPIDVEDDIKLRAFITIEPKI